MNTIYLIRHSVKYSKDNLKYKNGSDRNNYDEKICLSVIGEKRAETLSKEPIFNDVELIYSSNMVRSIQTAKYLAKRLDLEINIDSRLNERKCGLPNYNEYPDWFERQYYDENFKTIDGESQKETCNRVYECIKEILNSNDNKKIAIFSHGYAITFLLLKWCKIVNIGSDRKITLKYKDKIIMDKIINAPEVFRLEFDKDKLINIELIEFDDLKFHNGDE